MEKLIKEMAIKREQLRDIGIIDVDHCRLSGEIKVQVLVVNDFVEFSIGYPVYIKIDDDGSYPYAEAEFKTDEVSYFVCLSKEEYNELIDSDANVEVIEHE